MSEESDGHVTKQNQAASTVSYLRIKNDEREEAVVCSSPEDTSRKIHSVIKIRRPNDSTMIPKAQCHTWDETKRYMRNVMIVMACLCDRRQFRGGQSVPTAESRFARSTTCREERRLEFSADPAERQGFWDPQQIDYCGPAE